MSFVAVKENKLSYFGSTSLSGTITYTIVEQIRK